MAVVLTLLVVAAVPAKAATGDRPLAVSVPNEPVVLTPGSTSTIRIRVLNPGTNPVTVRISGRHIDLGDNGEVTLGKAPDPFWKGRVQFPGGNQTIPAQAYINVDLTVNMPEKIDPDLYFVGFLVSPVGTRNGQGELQIVNQIGSFLTIDVPGPRLRKLAADLRINPSVFARISIPGIVIGNRASGILRVRNVGKAQVRFWGEVDSSSSPGSGGVTQDRIDKSLVPRGHSRKFNVGGKPAWPIGLVTLAGRIFYPGRTETSTREIIVTKRVLVVSPWVILAVILLLMAAVLYWRRRRRRRRRSAN